MCGLAQFAWLKMCIFEKSGRSPPVCFCLSCLHFIIVNNRKHFLNFPFHVDRLLLLSLCRYLIPNSLSSLSMCKNRLKQKSCSVFYRSRLRTRRTAQVGEIWKSQCMFSFNFGTNIDPTLLCSFGWKEFWSGLKCLDSPIYATTTSAILQRMHVLSSAHSIKWLDMNCEAAESNKQFMQWDNVLWGRPNCISRHNF